MNRRTFLKATPLVLASAMMGCKSTGSGEKMAVVPETPQSVSPPVVGRSSCLKNETALFTLTAGTKLRIMQMTDIHFGTHIGHKWKSEDAATVRLMHTLLEKFPPHLVISTGDHWWDNDKHQGQTFSEFAINQMIGLGIPWAFCWGNHDKADDVGKVQNQLATASHSLYRGANNHGDYRIEIRQVDEKGNITPAMDLWVLNSNQYGLQKWELDWYRRTWYTLREQRGKVLPSLGFFHIPIIEYKTMYDKEKIPGPFFEEQCIEKSDSSAYDCMKELNLKACFCGHDHVNDYMIPSDNGGPALIYGRATGIGAYGGDKVSKRAKMIEIDLSNGNFHQVTILPDGSTYAPWYD